MAGNTVEVEVIEKRSNDIIVKILGDTRTGRIRRRELSWDRSVRSAPAFPKIGEKLKAKIIGTGKNSRYLDLSLRKLIDPWQENNTNYWLGQIVRGEVVNIRDVGLFVQLSPGIDALVRPDSIPLSKNKKLEEIFSIGDYIEGEIIKFDREIKKIEVSVLKRLIDLGTLSLDARMKEQFNLLLLKNDHFVSENSLEIDNIIIPGWRSASIERLGRILVIDDTQNELDDVCKVLREEYKRDGVEVVGVISGSQAIQALSKKHFDLALIDINLKAEDGSSEDGVVLGKKILHTQPSLSLLFTSKNPLIEDKVTEIEGENIPFSLKESEEILDWIDRLCYGYSIEEVQMGDDIAYKGEGGFLRQLDMIAYARQPMHDAIQQILSHLFSRLGFSYSMLLEVDRINQIVDIVSVYPPFHEDLDGMPLDGLYFSPVRNVVEDEINIYEKGIKQYHKRYKNFFPSLLIDSFYGTSIKIPGFTTKYALFLLNEERYDLINEDFNIIEAAKQTLQITLERGLLLDYMSRYEKRYTRGLLLGSLVHELKNKLDAMGSTVDVLDAIVLQSNETTDLSKNSSDIVDSVKLLVKNNDEMLELVEAYRQIARGTLSDIDINASVYKVKRQMNVFAQESGCEIFLLQEKGLPYARSIESRLEQVLINLTLNGIQQIAEQRKHMEEVADIIPAKNDQVIIKTQYVEADGQYPIKIYIVDTGPGIRYQQQKEIFLLDTSTRKGGHGLGLFISSNLIGTMGGRIRLVDSVMFLGSVFVIELPIFQGNGK